METKFGATAPAEAYATPVPHTASPPLETTVANFTSAALLFFY